MDVTINEPPRAFRPAATSSVEIRDGGAIHLGQDEQVTFRTEAGGEYDAVRENRGFYATPSLNSRLPSLGLPPALIRNTNGRNYVVLVEDGHEQEFRQYLAREDLRVVAWLDGRDTEECPS